MLAVMAKRVVTQTTYTDDLDGSTAAGTIYFAYDGTTYEIDLSKRNAAAFEKAMRPFVDAARKVRSTRSRSSGRRNSGRDLAAVREWATANGYHVSSRGRIAADVIDAYDAAR